MRTIVSVLAAVLAVTTTDVLAGGKPPLIQQVSSSIGKIFVDERGMTLYTYQRDGRYRPHCLEDCAEDWPPLSVVPGSKSVGDWAVIARADGRDQWALNGQPLYRSARDIEPGDISETEGAWRVAQVPCPASRSPYGALEEEEAFAIVDAAIEAGVQPMQQLRRWCGVKLDDLAARAGMSSADLIAHENGRRGLNRQEAAAVANALGMPVYLLLE
jgi:predicted lipoprotein with Yx(FWY)xxD motif/DNA-binding XRE family transcriptional regulator